MLLISFYRDNKYSEIYSDYHYNVISLTVLNILWNRKPTYSLTISYSQLLITVFILSVLMIKVLILEYFSCNIESFCLFFLQLVNNMQIIRMNIYIHCFNIILIKDIHNSRLYCFTNPLDIGARVSLSHRQPYVSVGRRK